MAWWGLACGIVAVVLGIIALVRMDFARHEPVRVPVKPTAANSYVSALTDPDPEVQEWVIDFAGKRDRREASVAEWNEMFLAALGDDREAFVKEWADGSRRKRLAVELRVAEDLAHREGRDHDGRVLRVLRGDLVENPEQEVSPVLMDRIETYLQAVDRDRGRTQGVDTQKVRRNKPVRLTQEELKQMMQDDLAVLEREHQKRLDEDN